MIGCFVVSIRATAIWKLLPFVMAIAPSAAFGIDLTADAIRADVVGRRIFLAEIGRAHV